MMQHPDITAAERTGYPCNREPIGYLTCDWCGENIYLSEDYYDIHGEILCVECVNECKVVRS